MRKLLRSIARHNMKKAGVEQINKKTIRTENGAKSKFSLYLKKFLTSQASVSKRKFKASASR